VHLQAFGRINSGKQTILLDSRTRRGRRIREDGHLGLGERSLTPPNRQLVLFAAAGLALLMAAWALAAFFVDQARFAVYAPQFHAGTEAAAAFARLFAALVLFLSPTEGSNERLRWVASGLLVLGLGDLGFGYLEALLGEVSDLNTTIYEALFVWTAAGALFAAGLLPKKPIPLTRNTIVVIITALGVMGIAIDRMAELLPPLVKVTAPRDAVVLGTYVPRTVWLYVLLSTIQLAVSVAAAVGAARLYRCREAQAWLLLAMIVLAGAQLQAVFWPSTYSPVLATSEVLQLAFAAAVAVGGALELRRVAIERSRLLAVEKEHTRHLEELAAMKADFTAMVAHELNTPLSAIRALTDMLQAKEDLDPAVRKRALDSIQGEAGRLSTLVNDVRTSASVEHDDFAVDPRPVPLGELLSAAASYAATLPGDHPLTLKVNGEVVDSSGSGASNGRRPLEFMVRADPERLGQVLSNLLSNAAKYSPRGTPIELRAFTGERRVRLEVADRGHGIHPDDLSRIFEKFGRGRDRAGRKVGGVGLGLYLSRRILGAHGSELTVGEATEGGSVFAFELERAQEDGP
jgi:signal transduction histidine kinase